MALAKVQPRGNLVQFPSSSTFTPAMLIVPWLLLTALHLVLAVSDDHQKLIDLAVAGNGNIKLDAQSFQLLTSPKRSWSAALQLTALNKQRRCAPCSEFAPSFTAVAQAWKKTTKEHRDSHFFATLDFDDAQVIFQQVGRGSNPPILIDKLSARVNFCACGLCVSSYRRST